MDEPLYMEGMLVSICPLLGRGGRGRGEPTIPRSVSPCASPVGSGQRHPANLESFRLHIHIEGPSAAQHRRNNIGSIPTRIKITRRSRSHGSQRYSSDGAEDQATVPTAGLHGAGGRRHSGRASVVGRGRWRTSRTRVGNSFENGFPRHGKKCWLQPLFVWRIIKRKKEILMLNQEKRKKKLMLVGCRVMKELMGENV